MEEQRLTKRQVAKRYSLSLGTLNYLIKTGQIPHIRLGPRIVRFDEKALAEWEQSRLGGLRGGKR